MSHAEWSQREHGLSRNPFASPTTTTRKDWFDRRATTTATSVTFVGRRRPRQPSSPRNHQRDRRAGVAKSTRTEVRRRRRQEPCRHGSRRCRTRGPRPRTSRSSVVPISATQPAATGPPSTIAAMIGAIETLTNVPRGIRTGSAPANRVITDPERQVQGGRSISGDDVSAKRESRVESPRT